MELHVSATARDGAGVARSEDGRIVFVEGALAGETVTVELIRVDKRWSRARVVRVLDPSPERVPVPCTHQVEGCGGCDLLHVAAEAQLRMKSSMLVDQLVRAGVDAPHAALRSLDDDRGRTGDRSDGSSFTVDTFARYFLHDPVHHLVDVRTGYADLDRATPA